MKEDKMTYNIINKNCLDAFEGIKESIDLTFLDPPFNQQKNMLTTMIIWTKRTIGNL